ncbi:MAG: thiolase family protein [Sphingobium sp.]
MSASRAVYVVGVHATAVGRFADRSLKSLTREAVEGAIPDAGLEQSREIGSAWFANCGMWVEGQGSIRGQVMLTPLIREGVLAERLPVFNIEGGCASAAMALQGARKDIAAGDVELALAVAAERTFYPDAPERTAALFNGGIDQFDPHEWQDYYARAGEVAGKRFETGADRTVFMDTYAMQAAHHMARYGTTIEQIAAVAAKNHSIAVDNPKAQYRFPMTVEQVIADRPVSYPLTRAMCAPLGDGAAAAILCSQAWLDRAPAAVQAPAVRIAGTALTSGKYRGLDEPSLSHVAAQRAYAMAGVGPARIDLAEVHDATAFSEIYQSEMLGFCAPGEGGALAQSGASALGGSLPINLSGGLESKGHPVGATGLMMIEELVRQLRGEAGARQAPRHRIALAETGGGVVGFDEGACAVTILER